MVEGAVTGPGRSLILGKTWDPLYRRTGKATEPVWIDVIKLARMESDPQTVQFVASRYTHYANWPLVTDINFNNIMLFRSGYFFVFQTATRYLG